jgi:hypothetical protein
MREITQLIIKEKTGHFIKEQTFNIMYVSTYENKTMVDKHRFWKNYTKAFPELGLYFLFDFQNSISNLL